MATTTERPEDVANDDYYRDEMKTRRVRIVAELDVEWRDEDPDYSLSIATTDALALGVRMPRGTVTRAEYIDER